MKKRIAITIFSCLFAAALLQPALAADKGLSHDGKKFLKEAAIGGIFEVDLGKIAEQKAQSPDVKAFGTRMATDHGKANDELKSVAQQKKEKLPAKLDAKHQKVVNKLSKASGADFDKLYMEEMVKDHTADVAVFQAAVNKVKDPDLSGWASRTLPVIQDHLNQAKDIAQKLGVDVNKAEQEGQKEAGKH